MRLVALVLTTAFAVQGRVIWQYRISPFCLNLFYHEL